jgi:hypothetical protein
MKRLKVVTVESIGDVHPISIVACLFNDYKSIVETSFGMLR